MPRKLLRLLRQYTLCHLCAGYDNANQLILTRSIEILQDYVTENQIHYDMLGRRQTERRLVVACRGAGHGANNSTDRITVYGYDKLGHVTLITYPDTKTIQYACNSTGQVWRRVDHLPNESQINVDGAGHH